MSGVIQRDGHPHRRVQRLAVSLSVSGLPKGGHGVVEPKQHLGASTAATLQIDTASNTQTDTYALSVTGTGTIGRGNVSLPRRR